MFDDNNYRERARQEYNFYKEKELNNTIMEIVGSLILNGLKSLLVVFVGFYELGKVITNINNKVWTSIDIKIRYVVSFVFLTVYMVFSVAVFMEIYVFLLVGIVVCTILGIVKYVNRNSLNDKFREIKLYDNNEKLPKLLKHIKITEGVDDYYLHSKVPPVIWDKHGGNLDFVFDRVTKVDYLGNSKYKIRAITYENYEEIERSRQEKEIEKINYKHGDLSIKDKIKRVFRYLDLDIYDIKTKECVISTIIYFNSGIDINRMNNVLPEIKARLKNNNMLMKVSNVVQFDYMFVLLKSIKQITYLKVLSEVYNELNEYELPLLLGMDLEGNIKHKDMKNDVHYLVGGTTGSGKTNNIHNIICTMLLSKAPITMIMIDVKNDLVCYKGIDNVFRIDASDIDLIIDLLASLKEEMITRTKLYTEFDKCDSLEKYNNLVDVELPYIVIFIEEYAELLSRCTNSEKTEVEEYIKSLTQLSRSVGYKIFISTQSPRKEVITPIIKTNCPNRQCFMVASIPESNIMLDSKEATCISQVGQYIHRNSGQDEHLQAVYIPDKEHEMILDYLKSRNVKTIDHTEEKIIVDKKSHLKRIK